jgi:predicted metal-dependent peptidase
VDEKRWNTAADAEINDDLVAGSATRPQSAVTPFSLRLPDGWTAEQYWDALGGATSQEAAPRDDVARSSSDCGSGCDGQRRPWDSGQPGLGPGGQKLLERDVAQRINEHQQRYGSTPAGWRRWASEVLEPTVSWQRVLASAVRRGLADVSGRVDFTYRKPSRRSSVAGSVILPSLRQPLPKVAMVLDTSGSMNDHLLAQSLAEVQGVLRGLGVGRRHLNIVCCDAQAFEAQKVMQARDVELLGGGGTDMGAGLAKAAEIRPRPDLIVVLTDGQTPWPTEPPRGIRVIVGLMDRSGHAPQWAKAIPIGTDDAA